MKIIPPPVWSIVSISFFSLASLGYLIGINVKNENNGIDDMINIVFSIIGGTSSLIAIIFASWAYKQWKTQRNSGFMYDQYLELIVSLIDVKNYTGAITTSYLLGSNPDNNTFDGFHITIRKARSSLEKIKVISELDEGLEEKFNSYIQVAINVAISNQGSSGEKITILINYDEEVFHKLKQDKLAEIRLLDSQRIMQINFENPNFPLFHVINNWLKKEIYHKGDELIEVLKEKTKQI